MTVDGHMTGVSRSLRVADTARSVARTAGVATLAGLALVWGGAVAAPPANAASGEGGGSSVMVTKSHQTGATPPAITPASESPGILDASDMPELPALDPALNPESPEGRMAALVRHRVVGMITMLGSMTKGDIVATDGPITARPSAEGGVRVTFKDLTVRAFSATGSPVVMAVGDVVVDASDADTEGAVTYEYSISGPVQLYQGGRKIGAISMGGFLAKGDIDPDTPMLGRDELSLESIRLDVDDVAREPVFVTIGSLTALSESDVDDDDTINALIEMTLNDLGIGRGGRSPTVRMAETRVSSAYDALPVAWLQVFDLIASATRLPTQEEILALNGRLLRDTTLGLSEGTIETTGLEVFISPDESVTVDRLFLETVIEEPQGGDPANGSMDLAMDGLRTKGVNLETAVDLGALRLSLEGEGLDAEMLRVFLADGSDLMSAMPTSLPGQPPPPPPPGWENKMLGLFAPLVRDMGIGEAEWALSLAGLAVRAERREVFALGSMTVEGGWDENDTGLVDVPGRLEMTDLMVVNQDSGLPISIDSLVTDILAKDLDLASLRSMAVLAMDSYGVDEQPPEPGALQAIVDAMVYGGGHTDLSVKGVLVGTEQAPMGGLGSMALRIEMDSAPSGADVTNGSLSLQMDGLNAGPMATAAVPADLLPGGAGIGLAMTNLPVPVIMRMQMDFASLMEGTEPEPELSEDQVMALVMQHQPSFDLETVSLEAPAYSVSGSGRIKTDPTSPVMFGGSVSLQVRGLDDTLAVVQERARIDPSMQQAVPALIALRGLGRVEQQGTHIFDLVLSPEQGVLINDVPAAMLMMQGPGAPPSEPMKPGQTGPVQ